MKWIGAGVGAKGPAIAAAVAEPAIEDLQATFGPELMITLSLLVHCGRPLVESFSVLGNVIAISFAVVLLSWLLVTLRGNLAFAGLGFVPDLDGGSLAGPVTTGAAGVWAYATPAAPKARTAAPAA